MDLEADRDLASDLLAVLPPERRVLSWHGDASGLEPMRQRLERMSELAARWYKLVPGAGEAETWATPLALLASVGRDDVIAFAGGEAGVWTRLLAPRLGAPVIFAASGAPAAPGQPALDTLVRDYGIPELPELSFVCGVVGHPVGTSLSPRLHNALYRRCGLPGLYLAFDAPSFGDFWLEIVEGGSFTYLGAPLTGLSVTAPHKPAAAAVAGALSPVADHLNAANTLVLRNGVWAAETTDPEGVLRPLERRGFALRDRHCAVLGAGGAGVTAAWALGEAGARVVMVNRSEERGRRAAELLELPFQALAEFEPERFELLLHATPLGARDTDRLPFDPERLRRGAAVVDLVYRDGAPTRLVEETRALGHVAVDGREVLAAQAEPQFERMTGERFDRTLAWEVLGLEET